MLLKESGGCYDRSASRTPQLWSRSRGDVSKSPKGAPKEVLKPVVIHMFAMGAIPPILLRERKRSAGLHVPADPIHDHVQGGSRKEDFCNTHGFQFARVLFRDDTTSDDHDIVGTLSFQQVHEPLKQI